LIVAVKFRQDWGLKASTGPRRSLVSRMRTRRSGAWLPISTQLPPP